MRLEGGGFTDHYLRELEYLRREGGDFAERYPKVAGRLKLSEAESPDPHVERLLESFAFLTARVQRKLDDDFAEVAEALLEVLHPQLTRPIPSMALAEVGLDFEQAVPVKGRFIPRDAMFLSKPVHGEAMRFRACADTRLWPIRILAAAVDVPDGPVMSLEPKTRSMLRVTLEAVGEHPFGALELEQLRLFLKGEPRVAHALYESLSCRLLGVQVEAHGARGLVWKKLLRPEQVVPFGFEEDQAALPSPRRSFSGYRLLQEYFAYPRKFHAFDVGGLADMRGTKATHVDLVFLLDREPGVPASDVTGECFSLSCVPLVNAFEMTADPIVATGHVSEHDVVPESMRPLDFEVLAVQRVMGIQSSGDRVQYVPFYALRHDSHGEVPGFWYAHRRPSQKAGDAGTEVSLVLCGLDHSRLVPEDETLHVDVLCSNRDLPASIGQWGRPDDFTVAGISGFKSVCCVGSPSSSFRLDVDGSPYWRLISQLSLNYLSLVREGRGHLQEILRTYDVSGSPANRLQIEGIVDLRSESVVRKVRGRHGSGFARGTQTTLSLDREHFVGGSPVLFAAVLDRFLALSCSLSSFSQLVLETPQDQGEIHRWPPRTGTRILL